MKQQKSMIFTHSQFSKIKIKKTFKSFKKFQKRIIHQIKFDLKRTIFNVFIYFDFFFIGIG